MITFPNCKINLGLSVTEKRADGYHNLETVFYPVGLEDALEIHALEAGQPCTLRLYGAKTDDIPADRVGNAEDNLVMKAYRLLEKEFTLPPVEIHLYKHIPSGAGLGGGSADAAFMLRLLNDRFGLNLSKDRLEAYASTLGADCAFFIRNRPIFAEGIGNIFSPVDLYLFGYPIVIVKPHVFVSTREAFANIRPHRPEQSVKEVVELPIEQWKDLLVNDFEAGVFALHPVIGEIKAELYRQGATYAAMSGSGSSVFGLWMPENTPPKMDFGKDAFCFTGSL